jgi:hypothetical protein
MGNRNMDKKVPIGELVLPSADFLLRWLKSMTEDLVQMNKQLRRIHMAIVVQMMTNIGFLWAIMILGGKQ